MLYENFSFEKFFIMDFSQLSLREAKHKTPAMRVGNKMLYKKTHFQFYNRDCSSLYNKKGK
ncbi:hypothetical protein COD67_20520 [Bacillus cereus]|nr:hypothetical protein COI89_24265 [Bacillus cereus]PGU63588.1 hypothetical protein COD67_20520 [Bacillus cereus]